MGLGKRVCCWSGCVKSVLVELQEDWLFSLSLLTDRDMIVLRGLGWIFLLLGAIGILVPLWPVTIFWILAALCFAKSSPKTRDWIYNRPAVGPVIEGLIERGELSSRSKMGAIIGLLIAAACAAPFLLNRLFWLFGLVAVLTLVGLYVVSRPVPDPVEER